MTFDETLKSEKPVLVAFSAIWCGPCQTMKPILLELEKEYAGRLEMLHLDVAQNMSLVNNYGVKSVPTYLFFKGGKVVDQQLGADAKELRGKIALIVG